MRTSFTANNISPSMTLSIGEKAKKLKKEGIDIISFAQGEPDFNTPEAIKQAGIKAIEDNFTRYTATSGIKELKEAISLKLKNENGIEYSPEEIVVSTGAKQVIYNTLLSLCGSGDEVIIPTPCWVSYTEQVKMVGAKPILVETLEAKNFVPEPHAIAEKITPKTKAIILSTPNNPTGAVYGKDVLKEIAELAVKNQIFIIADEVYEKLIYDSEKHISIAGINEKIKELTVTINGWSKAYAMTGWRLGYAAGPVDIIEAIDKLQGHITGNPNSISQKAGLYALLYNEDYNLMIPEYNRRRKYIVDKLNSLNGINCRIPKGAFYVFPNVKGLYGKKVGNKIINSSMDVATFLLDEAHVAVVPGEAFAAEGYIRLSYVTPIEDIKRALNQIEKALKKLDNV
ncbi:pyridoxal phosphate-dependent aminotransferase [Clostridium lundense]|uniref:pyridoxal phosphate-dependent aminotransferase n=1 Tax=Clostridium lundense TaxID=319475 RepID=UPI000487A41C|nr:pyridoxal phosphate-dependent aminotransferase [Clostridium lundense]